MKKLTPSKKRAMVKSLWTYLYKEATKRGELDRDYLFDDQSDKTLASHYDAIDWMEKRMVKPRN